MAERNVSVRLSANVGQYMAAMASAKAATTGLSTGAARNFTQLGGAMQQVGKMATIGVTLPLVALGAGAVSMAAKFDTAFAQMVGLANVPAAEVDALKESVLSLAGETAVAPQELAEGLYFAASAGLDSAAAMEVLEMAARASASGMGTTADVVNLVSGAIAAYGSDNITAAQATDVLTAAIREGKAEPSEFAGALGRVTPIAAAMGIEFGEVAGAAAFMSNILGDTDETITALRGALLAMLDPTKQGRDTLEDMGTSYGELKAAISQDGLLGGLELLREHGFAENSEAMSNLFEDNRALVGATILLQDETGQLSPIIDRVTNSLGAADSAFDAVSETAGFKMKQSMTEIKVAMIEVGEILLPLAADVASTISGMIGWFTDLSPAVQELVMVFGGLAAAAGPAVFVAGSLVRNWAAVSGVFKTAEGATSKLGRAAGVLGLVGLAAGAAYLAFKFFTRSEELATTHIDTASGALENETVAVYNAAVAAGQATTQVDALAIAHLALSNAISEAADDELNTALATLNITSEETLDVLTRLGSGSLPTIQAEMQRLTEDYFGLDAAQAQVALNMRGQGKSYEEIASTIGATVEVVEAWDNALGTTTTFADQNKDEINDLALSYLNLQARIPGAASEALLAAEAIAGSRDEAGNAVPVYEEYIRQLTLMDPAAAQAALATGGMVSSINELIPGLGGATDGFEGLGEAAMVAASSIDTMSRDMQYWEDVAHTLDEYSSAIDTALGAGGEWVRQHYDMAKGFREFADAITDGDGEIDLLTQGIDANTEAGYENAGSILDMADQIIAMTKANLEAGKGQEETNREYQAARTGLLDAAEAAGLNRGKVEELINTYGLVPELVTTAMQLANDALMKWRIDQYIAKLDEIPEEEAVAIEAAIDAGDWAEANRLLQVLTAPRGAPITPYLTRSELNVRVNQVINPFSSAVGRFIPGGSNLLTTTAEIGGSRGDEVILPLGDPSRMAALLGMSQVGPRVAAAFGKLMPYSAPMTAGSAIGGGGGDTWITNNNSVIMPPGSDGDDVVRALKKWQRRSGPLPLSVR